MQWYNFNCLLLSLTLNIIIIQVAERLERLEVNVRRQVREALTGLPDEAALLSEILLKQTPEEERLRVSASEDSLSSPASATAALVDAVAGEDRLMCAIVDAL